MTSSRKGQKLRIAPLSVEESVLRELLVVLNLASDSIILRKMDDTICYWNDGAERLYGWTNKEVYGRESHDLFDTIFPQPLAQIRGHLVERGFWEGILDHARKDGTRIRVHSRWTLYRDVAGTPAKYVEINRPIDVDGNQHTADTLLAAAFPHRMHGRSALSAAAAVLLSLHCRSCGRAVRIHRYANCEQRLEALAKGHPVVPDPIYPNTWWNVLLRRRRTYLPHRPAKK